MKAPLRALDARLGDHRPFVRGSAYAVAQLSLLAVGSFAFWLIAARRHPADVVGEAAALQVLLSVVSAGTSFGLAVAVGRFARDHSRESQMVLTWVLAAVVAVAAVGAVGLTLFGTRVADPIARIGSLGGFAMFFGALVGQGVATVLDNRQLALRQGPRLLVRTAVPVFIRLPLIVVASPYDEALWIFTVAALSTTAVNLVALVVDRVSVGPLVIGWDRVLAGRVGRYAAANVLSQAALQAPFVLLPIFVAARVADERNAQFFVAWGIASVLFLVPGVIGRALLAEGDRGVELARQVRVALILAGGFGVVAAAASLPGAALLPLAYGDDYTRSGTVLVLLLAALVPYAVTSVALAEARVRADNRATLAISTALAVAVLVPATALLQEGGIVGAAQGWLAGNVAAAFVATAVISTRRAALTAQPARLGEQVARMLGVGSSLLLGYLMTGRPGILLAAGVWVAALLEVRWITAVGVLALVAGALYASLAETELTATLVYALDRPLAHALAGSAVTLATAAGIALVIDAVLQPPGRGAARAPRTPRSRTHARGGSRRGTRVSTAFAGAAVAGAALLAPPDRSVEGAASALANGAPFPVDLPPGAVTLALVSGRWGEVVAAVAVTAIVVLGSMTARSSRLGWVVVIGTGAAGLLAATTDDVRAVAVAGALVAAAGLALRHAPAAAGAAAAAAVLSAPGAVAGVIVVVVAAAMTESGDRRATARTIGFAVAGAASIALPWLRLATSEQAALLPGSVELGAALLSVAAAVVAVWPQAWRETRRGTRAGPVHAR